MLTPKLSAPLHGRGFAGEYLGTVHRAGLGHIAELAAAIETIFAVGVALRLAHKEGERLDEEAAISAFTTSVQRSRPPIAPRPADVAGAS